MDRVKEGLWSIGTSGVSYLDSVSVNHGWQEGKPPIDTWQKAKKYFSRWHKGTYILTWYGNHSFKCYRIVIK